MSVAPAKLNTIANATARQYKETFIPTSVPLMIVKVYKNSQGHWLGLIMKEEEDAVILVARLPYDNTWRPLAVATPEGLEPFPLRLALSELAHAALEEAMSYP